MLHVDVADSGWTIFAAWGAFIGALATPSAVVAALVSARNDRRAARKALEDQWAHDRDRQAREHELDLLIRLQEQVALARSQQTAPQGAAASEVAGGLVLALSDSTDLVAVRTAFPPGHNDPGELQAAVTAKYGGPKERGEHLGLALQEIGDRIKSVANE
jgi:hypothetical protein